MSIPDKAVEVGAEALRSQSALEEPAVLARAVLEAAEPYLTGAVDEEQVYNAAVAAGAEKAELEVAVNGIALTDRDRALIAASVGVGATEILIQIRDMRVKS